jgi:hypothetical protein
LKITGHATSSVFKRYGIVTIEDLKWAAEKQAENLKPLQKPLQLQGQAQKKELIANG